MKRVLVFLLSIISILGLIGCGRKVPEVRIDYGTSSIYTQKDMDAAIELIKKEFDTWDGCELHSISYSSDDEYTDWQWWLARPTGGQWKLMTWGY